MSTPAMCLCLLTFNAGLACVAWLVCRACDAVEQPEQVERRLADEEFAAIVAASLADMERQWRDE